ncbi:MAG: hypothetical protein FWD75_05675 [Propionibacteriaceae bacterium]|nr:hypothetical protein [Propionibacteriaceae bacterium]
MSQSTVPEDSTPQPRPLLQQAPVVPLDASGFTAALVGTLLFALATVGFVLTDTRGQWLYIVATGTAFGVFLILYTAWHRWWWRPRRDAAQAPTPTSVED